MTPLIAHTPASPHRLVACYHRPMLTDGDDSLRIGRGGGEERRERAVFSFSHVDCHPVSEVVRITVVGVMLGTL